MLGSHGKMSKAWKMLCWEQFDEIVVVARESQMREGVQK
jgi:hypothetical protein